MKVQNILLVVLATFSSIILIGQIYVNQNAEALALTSSDVTMGASGNASFYQASNDQFVSVPNQATTATSSVMTIIHSGVATPTKAFHTLKPVKGDLDIDPTLCNIACPQITDSHYTGGTRGLWCGQTDCFTFWISTNSSYPHQLWRVSTSDSAPKVTGYMNITYTTKPWEYLGGYDQSGVGIGGVTMFYVERCASSSNMLVRVVGGTSKIGISATMGLCSGGIVNAPRGIETCYNCGGVAGTKRVAISFTTTAGVDYALRVYNPATLTETCHMLQSALPNAGAINSNVGALAYGGDTLDKWFLGTQTSGTDQLHTVNRDTCAISTTITTGQLGVGNYIHSIAVNPSKGMYFVYGSSAQSLGVLSRMNITALTTNIDTTVSYSAGQTFNSMALDTEHQEVLLSTGGIVSRILFLEGFSTTGGISGTTGTTVCIDTNMDGHTDVCFRDSNGDGVADSSPIGIVTAQNGPVSGTGKLLCQLRVIEDCTGGAPTNDDPKTNGIGYILYFIVLFGMLALLGSIVRGQIVQNYGLMFAVAIVVGSAGLVYSIGWLDNTLMYVSIFIVIAIAGTKIGAMVLQNRAGGE